MWEIYSIYFFIFEIYFTSTFWANCPKFIFPIKLTFLILDLKTVQYYVLVDIFGTTKRKLISRKSTVLMIKTLFNFEMSEIKQHHSIKYEN